VIALASALALAVTVPAPPTYLVERVVTTGEEVRRISVFRDGVAVLARRHGGEVPSIVKARLNDVSFGVIRQVVEETYPDLKVFAGFGGGAGEASIELRLAPRGEEPLVVHIPVSAVQSAALVRLERALDDIDDQLGRTRVDQQDLTRWRPEVGQHVELSNGTVVEILEVFGGTGVDVVHVRVGNGPGHVFYTLDELRRLAVKVLDR
jgi:hypothetical protein